MKDSIIKGYKFALYIDRQILEHFLNPVWEATLQSVRATYALPYTIAQAVRDYKESVELEKQMDEALIDHGFLDRAMLGITQEDEQKIADFMKAAK